MPGALTGVHAAFAKHLFLKTGLETPYPPHAGLIAAWKNVAASTYVCRCIGAGGPIGDGINSRIH